MFILCIIRSLFFLYLKDLFTHQAKQLHQINPVAFLSIQNSAKKIAPLKTK